MAVSDPESRVADAAHDPEIRALVEDSLSGISVAAAGANVIMQLSQLPVGHGVASSNLDSGRVDEHPIKRTRTTLAYLVIALTGTDDERAAMRREVNRQHRQVRSGPEDAVAYDAMDPGLQLWVAACLYQGVQDIQEVLGIARAEFLPRRCRACSARSSSCRRWGSCRRGSARSSACPGMTAASGSST